MINTIEFYNYLIKQGVDFFAGVPDSLLKNLCACVTANTPKSNNIITANEGNAVGICAGYYMSTGKPGLVYMQNSGEGNAINPLVSIADEDVYSIPMLLVIGWRGEPGTKDEPQHIKQGKVTQNILDVVGIEHIVLDDDYREKVDYCIKYMAENSKPIALIVRKNTFSDFAFENEKKEFCLNRESALESIVSCLCDSDFTVTTTGKTSREVFEIRERNGQDHSHDFLTVGGMGHTSSIALGVSLGTEKNVFCIDGDGSFIMHMGSFAVIADNAPSNFKYIVNNNGAHESVGGQPTVGQKIDVSGILKSCGFKNIHTAYTKEEIVNAIEDMKNEELTALIIYSTQGSRDDLGRPTVSPKNNKIEMMKKIQALKAGDKQCKQ